MKEIFAKPAVGMLVERIVKGEMCLLMQVRDKPNAPEESGLLEFPGGKIREGESVVDTIRRELMEETGLTLSSIEGVDVGERVLVPHYDVIAFQPFLVTQNTHSHYAVIHMCFRCTAKGEPFVSSNESRDICWMPIDKLKKQLEEVPKSIYPMDRLVLQRYFKIMQLGI